MADDINKALWRELNSTMKSRGYKDLTEFIPCILHTMHSACKRDINFGGYGEIAEQPVLGCFNVS